MTKVLDLIDKSEVFLRPAMHVIFLIALIRGDVEGMVASGTISTWFKIESLQKEVKNGRSS